MIGLLVQCLLAVAIGYLAAGVALRAIPNHAAGTVFRISLGAGLGAGIISCLHFLIWVLIGPSSRWLVSAELASLALLAAAFWKGRVPGSAGAAAGGRPLLSTVLLMTAFLAALAIAGSLFADTAGSNPYGGWDALAIWNLRAKFLAQNDASWRYAYSHLLNHTHPDYPLLLSGFIAACWNLMGSAGEPSAPIAAAALFALATVGLMVSALAMHREWSLGWLGGIILLATPAFVLEGPDQYSDIPVGFYYLSVFTLALLAAETERCGAGVVAAAGLAGGFAAWTKNEGLLFLALSAMGLAALLLLRKRVPVWRLLLFLALGAAAPVLITVYFKFLVAPETGTFAHLTFAESARKLLQFPRYVQVAKAFWKEGTGFGLGALHPIVPLAVLVGCLGLRPPERRGPAIVLSLVLLAVFLGYFFAFVVTPLDLAWHLGTSLGRLYVQLWPSFVFLGLNLIRSPRETATVIEPSPKSPAARARKGKKARVG